MLELTISTRAHDQNLYHSCSKTFTSHEDRDYAMKHVRPSYLNATSVVVLALLAYANASITFQELNLQSQLMVAIPLIMLWFIIAGLRLESAIFASIGMMPSVTVWGFGYMKFDIIALNISNILMAFTVCMFISRPQPLHFTKCISLFWILFGACCASTLLTANPFAYLGQLMRLGLDIIFFTIVLSSQINLHKKSVLHGMLLWPIIALSSLAGVEGFWRFMSFGNGAALNPNETGELLLGSNTIVIRVIFLLPLFILFKAPRITLLLLISWLLVLSVFSYSRSLAIGMGTSMLLYLWYVNLAGEKITKLVVCLFLVISLSVGIAALENVYFNKGESDYVRNTKIQRAWNTFTENPVLGIGYGAVGVIDTPLTKSAISTEDPNYLIEITDVQASAEFTPSQILAETGIAGLILSLFLIVVALKNTVLLLKNPQNPYYIKITMLCFVVYSVAIFVGGNAFSFLVFFVAIPIIFNRIEWRGNPRFKI